MTNKDRLLTDDSFGKIIPGKDIGKRVGDNYVEVKCPQCGELRLILVTHTKRSNFTGLCLLCNSKAKRDHPRLDNHWCWKGGRIVTDDGYIFIKVYPNSPYFSMATKKDYVKEHRLVMAEHLNRCLESWEVVHHINGDKQDNRIENLALLPSCEYHDMVEYLTKSVREQTLQEVGEWLDKRYHNEDDIFISTSQIAQLKSGVMPKE